MFSIAKRITSGVVAGAVVIGTLAVYPNITGRKNVANAAKLNDEGYTAVDGYNVTIDTTGTVNYKTVLGRSIAYGIVADSWTQNNHAETNFAVNTYTGTGHKLEPDLAGTAPLSFIVGNITGTKEQGLSFGTETYAHIIGSSETTKYNIYTSQSIKDNYYTVPSTENGFSYTSGDNYYIWQDGRDDDGTLQAGVPQINVLYDAGTLSSVNTMINNAKSKSVNLSSKPSTIDITKYENTHSSSLSINSYIIDLDVDEYENAVVYIDVPYGSLLGEILRDYEAGYTGTIKLLKRSSTVVVFNFSDEQWTKVNPRGPMVKPVDKNIDPTFTDDDGFLSIDTDKEKVTNDRNKTVEEEIVEKVIWNMPHATTGTIQSAGGSFLFTAENANIKVEGGTSCGYLVVNGHFENNGCEWHFLNGTRNAYLYFSGVKAFTKSFDDTYTSAGGDKELYEDNTVSFNAGDFTFLLYNADVSESGVYTTNGEAIDSADVDASGRFEFHELSGLTPGVTYHYIIKEAANTINGITNSDGEIDIEVVVGEDSTTGELIYTISSYKYLTAADKAAGTVEAFRTNDSVRAQELNFYFGKVFNLIDTGSLIVEKVVEGDTTDPNYSSSTEYKVEISFDKTGIYSLTLPNSNTAVRTEFEAGKAKTYSILAGEQIKIEQIPVDVVYTVSEKDLTSAQSSAGYAKDTIINATGTIAKDTASKATVKNTYTQNTTDNGKIVLTKTIKGPVTNEDLSLGVNGIQFDVYEGNSTTSIWSHKLGETSYFTKGTDASGNTTYTAQITGLDTTKTYKVVESKHLVEGYDVVVTYSIGGASSEDGVTATGISPTTSGTAVDFEDAYTRITGTLTVDKNLSGVTGNENKAFKFTVKVGTNDGYLQADGKIGTSAYEFTVTPGTDCTVPVDYAAFNKTLTVIESETGREIDGYTFSSVAYEDNGQTIASKNDVKKTTITNTYTQNTTDNGKIVLTKTIKGPVTNEDLSLGVNGIQFDVYEGNSTTSIWSHKLGETSYFTKGTDASGNTTYTAQITGLDTTKTYKVVESKHLVEGYDVVVTYSIGGASSEDGVTATGISPTTSGTAVDFEDAYTRITGTLTVDKNLSGVTGNENKAFKFTVKVGTNDGYLQADGKIGTSAYEFTVTPGTDCTVPVDYAAFNKTLTVIESETGREIDGYTFSSVAYEDNGQTIASKNDVKKTTITNTYTQNTTDNGKIVLTKTIKGPVTNEDLSLGVNGIQFDVYEGNSTTSIWSHKLGETSYFTKGTDASGNTTYTAQITGLDTTKTYKVVESKHLVEGYDVVVTYSIGGASSEDGVTATGISPTTSGTAVDFEDAYTRITGTLTVDKNLSGVTGNENKAFKFTVKVGTNDGYLQADGKIGTSAYEFTVTPGTDCTVPVDYAAFNKTLTVIESETGREIDGYTFSSVAYEDNGQTIASKNDVKKTTITNTYTQNTTDNGKIVLTKTIKGPVTNEDLSLGVNGIQFDVYEGNSTTSIWSHKLGETSYFTKGTDASGNTTYTAQITGLDTTKTYKVVESKHLVEGYDVVVTYSIGGASSEDGVTATGISPTTSGTAVDFEDAYTRITGTLTVDKNLSGVTGNENKAFKFTVKVGTNDGYLQADGKIGTSAYEFTVTPGTDLDVTVDYSAFGKTLTVEELDTDREISGFDFSNVDYEDNGQTIASKNDVKKTTITNTYTPNQNVTPAPTGAITVSKSVDDPNGLAPQTEYKFTVSCSKGYVQDETSGTCDSDPYEFTVSAGGSVDISGLELGYIYTVEEVAVTGTGFICTATYTDSKEVTLDLNNKTGSVAIKNTYTSTNFNNTPGTLSVAKTVTGSTSSSMANYEYKFTVSCSQGYVQDETSGTIGADPHEFTLKDGESIDISNLPDGEYYVEEVSVPAAPADYSWAPVTYTTSQTVTIDTQNNINSGSVIIVNKCEYSAPTPAPTKGSITITKDIVSGAPSEAYDKTYAFTVSGNGQSYTVNIDFTATDSATLSDLTPGTYTITEDKSAAAISTYRLDVTNDGASVSVDAGNDTPVTITNEYTKQNQTPQPTSGHIVFTKTFGGDVTEQEAQGCGLYFVITDTNGMFLKLDGTLTNVETRITLADLAHPSEKVWGTTIDNVPFGVYTVTEHNEAIYVGGGSVPYTFEKTSVITDTTTVSASSTEGKLVLTNEYTHPGFDVTISKQDIAGKEIAQAQLRFKSLDNHDLSGVVVTQNGVPVNYTLSENNTAITFITIDGAPSIIQGLFAGKYELEETVTPEAYLTAEKIVFILNVDGTVTDGNGKVSVYGSPIVMIDKADPTYQTGGNNTSVISANRSPIPSTGEGISYYACAGVLILGMCTAGFVGFGVYRKKKKEF